ncbi:hypothetical protein IRJ41_006133, partial [Triplophysa rosa]
TFNNINLTRNIHSNTQTAAVERKRARSVGDPPQTSKRDSLGHSKPRARRATPSFSYSGTVVEYITKYCILRLITHTPVECSLSSSVEVPLTVPSAELNPQEQFEKIWRGSLIF